MLIDASRIFRVLTKPAYIKIHTLHPTPHLTEKMADLLIFFSLVSTWKNVKPQQRLKTILTLKLNLRIMEDGKGYSKGVGPFRVPTMWVSKLSSQWYAPSNIEDLSFKRQAVLPQGGCTMTFAVSVFFFFFLSARSLSVETWFLSTGHVWHTTF